MASVDSGVNVYCRVSAGSSCSLDYQESIMKKACDELKWPVSNVYKCVSSAYKKMATYLSALSQIKNGKFMFYAVDRFSRDVKIGKELAKTFLKNGSQMYFVREKLLLNKSNFPTFIKYLEFAEQESKNISDRTSTAKRYLAANGYCVTASAPFGFKKRKLADGRSKIERNPKDTIIKKFIIACRTPNTHVRDLNKLLTECGAEGKLELSEGTAIVDDLSYENIADLLNEFELGDRKWTPNLISRIYKTNDRKVV